MNCKIFCASCGSDTDRTKDGKCKACQKIYNAAYREKNKENIARQQAAWYAAHREDRLKKMHDYRKSNPVDRSLYFAEYRAVNKDKTRAASAKYADLNKEKVRAKKAAWYAANSDRVKAQKARYNAENKEKSRIRVQNRRARVREACGSLSRNLAKKLFRLQRGKCACGCGQPLGDSYHLDHIMPIALGGANEDWNIQLLCATCNHQKSAKHPVDYMQQRGFLL